MEGVVGNKTSYIKKNLVIEIDVPRHESVCSCTYICVRVSMVPLFLQHFDWIVGQSRGCCINLYDFEVS